MPYCIVINVMYVIHAKVGVGRTYVIHAKVGVGLLICVHLAVPYRGQLNHI